jgi:thymidylate synthase
MSATWEWKRLLQILFNTGVDVSPRGQPTLEVMGHVSKINMRRPVINLPARGLNYRFMAAEALWTLSGSNRVSEIAQYCKHWERFSDDGIFLRGSYGPMFVEQVGYVADCLIRDPLTRQAVMSFWRVNPRDSKNIPCTLTIQFLVRDAIIHADVTMRSSDAWLGWPYDVFTFSMITWYVALMVNLKRGKGCIAELGDLTIFAGSQHLYQEHCMVARECMNAKWSPQDDVVYSLTQFNHPEDILDYLGNAIVEPNKTFERSPTTRLVIP